MKKNEISNDKIRKLETIDQLLFFAPNKFEQTFFNFKDIKEIAALLFEEIITHPADKEDKRIDL